MSTRDFLQRNAPAIWNLFSTCPSILSAPSATFFDKSRQTIDCSFSSFFVLSDVIGQQRHGTLTAWCVAVCWIRWVSRKCGEAPIHRRTLDTLVFNAISNIWATHYCWWCSIWKQQMPCENGFACIGFLYETQKEDRRTLSVLYFYKKHVSNN